MWWTKLLSSFKIHWKKLLVIILAPVIIFGIWKARNDLGNLIRKASGYDQMVQVVERQNKQIDRLIEETKKVREISRKRNKEIQKIRESIRSIPYEVEDTIDRNKKAADWADNTVPPAVVRSLRGEEGSNGNKNQTNGTSN